MEANLALIELYHKMNEITFLKSEIARLNCYRQTKSFNDYINEFSQAEYFLFIPPNKTKIIEIVRSIDFENNRNFDKNFVKLPRHHPSASLCRSKSYSPYLRHSYCDTCCTVRLSSITKSGPTSGAAPTEAIISASAGCAPVLNNFMP